MTKAFAVTGNLNTARIEPFMPSVPLLGNAGTVLIAGGRNSSYLSSAELYHGAQAFSGHVNPKYIVVGVTYAPPGHLSTVAYGHSTSLGTTTANSSSFAHGLTESVSIGGMTGECTGGIDGPIFGFFAGVCVTGARESSSYTQQSNSSLSVSVVNKTSVLNTTSGTPNDFIPINHDYDIVWLWLNPIASFTYVTPGNIQWNGFGFDGTDMPGLDIWPVLLGYLNGHLEHLIPRMRVY